jgi:guanylate kinase
VTGLSRSSLAFPIVVSGPSGAGKTTLAHRVLGADPLIRRSISTTTRSPRPGEVEGRDYFFVDRARFDRLKAGELVEWAEVHGACYGTRRDFVEGQLAAGRDVLLNIDIQGGDKVKKVFPGAVMVFILPPSLADLERRLRARGDLADADFKARLAAARAEIGASARYDYLVVNDDLDRASRDLTAIITAERCRRERAAAETVKRLLA